MCWFISIGISLLFHIALIFFFSLNLWPLSISVRPSAYTVTLLPVFQEPPVRLNTPSETMRERPFKPIEKIKKDDIVEKVKKEEKEKEKNQEALNRLHEALEEIRKKAALDQIQKRISKREVTKEVVPSPSPIPSPSPSPVASPAITPSLRESKLNEYYGLIWAKIKQAWTIPENLLKEKERVDLETIIVVIIGRDGRVQNSWFEKKSGNALYDQMAMRAILKAEPLPPLPKELNQETLEIGIRFFPD